MANTVRVKKSNRIVTIPKEQEESYLNRGYDRINEGGKITKRATGGKTISAAEHQKVIEENERLKAQLETDTDTSEVESLKEQNEQLKEENRELQEKARKFAEKGKQLEQQLKDAKK